MEEKRRWDEMEMEMEMGRVCDILSGAGRSLLDSEAIVADQLMNYEQLQ
jgi:hypothetical protein